MDTDSQKLQDLVKRESSQLNYSIQSRDNSMASEAGELHPEREMRQSLIGSNVSSKKAYAL